jgi:hypothetical protein
MSPVPPNAAGPARGRSRRTRVALLLGALAMAMPASAQAPTATRTPDSPPTRRVDLRTEEVMRRMSALLAATPRFALEAEESVDEVSDNAPRLQLTNVRRVAVARPDRMATDATGDSLNRVVLYDGHAVSVLDKDSNTYFTHEAPATIDATLDAVADKLGVVLPLSDFAYADPYAVLMEKVLYGEYRGVHQAAGVPCHHLAFTQENIEWQLWVDAGEQPLPRKVLITYVDEPGAPQYSATIRRWNLAPSFADDLFRFEPPEGATRVAVQEILQRGPGSEVAPAPGPPAEAPKVEEKR